MAQLADAPAAADPTARIATTLIEAGYRTLFGREPDPDGIAVYSAFLGTDPVARAEDLFRVLLSSKEATDRQREAVTLVQAHPGSRTIGRRDPARVVSLGSRCTVAEHLQRFGLRTASHPFDWIFSTPEIVVHAIEDDFDLFLRRDQYRAIPLEERAVKAFNRCDHLTYRAAFGQAAMFNHRDPTLPEDHAYLHRCVSRFRDVLASPEPTLFVLVTDTHGEPLPAYLRLFRVLEKACAGPAALLFVVVRNEASGTALPWVRGQRADGDHEFILFDAVGKLGGTGFDREVDEFALEALIRRYRLPGALQLPPVDPAASLKN